MHPITIVGMTPSHQQCTTYQVQDFALNDKIMQAVHDFFDTGSVVPPMDIEAVDVVCAKLLERIMHTIVHALQIVANKGGLNFDVLRQHFVARGILKP